MIVTTESSSAADRMAAWRRQIGHRHHLASTRGPRPFAVISYLVPEMPAAKRYIPLRRLTLVALYDQALEDGRLATRLVGVAAAVGPNGLRFGGVELSRFDKDLRLPPARGRLGARLDAADTTFFEFAMSLERYLERCARHPYMPRGTSPRLPALEAGANADVSTPVDVTTLPKRQVIRLDAPEHDLVGHIGTTSFDFYHTRFRVAG